MQAEEQLQIPPRFFIQPVVVFFEYVLDLVGNLWLWMRGGDTSESLLHFLELPLLQLIS